MAQANIRAVITAEDRASAVLSKFSSNIDGVANNIKAGVRKASLAFAVATTAAVTFAVKSASDFEQSRVAFDTMLGSAEKGKKIMKDLSDFARKTPFELPEVVEGAKKLLAYGISAENVMKDIKTLGDISAGVGREKLPFLTLAFGQVATKGKLAGQEIRQFTEAGVPLVEELAKSLGKTKEQIVEMSAAGEIRFEDVRKALEGMTGEGGKFFKLMEKQSRTFGGVVSNIKDNIGRLARSIVGISESGDIKEGSIFARLSEAGQKLLMWIDTNQGEITEKIQGLVDTMLEKGEAFTKAFADKVRSDGFASAVSQSLIEMLGKIQWDEFAARAVGLFFVIAPQIIKGLGEGLLNAAKENPLNMALLFGFLGFAPAVLTSALATVLGGIPIIGPIASWMTTAFGGAARAVVGSVSAAFAAVGAGAASAFQIALAAGAVVAVAAAAAVAVVEIYRAANSIKNAWMDVLNASNAAANLAPEGQMRQLQQQAKVARELGDTKKVQQIANALEALGGRRASGGPVMGGVPYLVGERGPEIVVPRQSGTVIPNNKINQSAGTTINLNVNVGMYAGTEMEKRKIAESLAIAYKDLQQSRGLA